MNTFIDAWIPEFLKSVEMFTGLTAVREESPAVSDTFRENGAEFWHAQEYFRGPSARMWLGMPMARCLTIGASAGDAEDERVALCREVVTQSLQAVAQVLNTGACPGLQCGAGAGTTAPPDSVLELPTLYFRIAEVVVPVMFRAEPEFDALLAAESPDVLPASAPAEPAETPLDVPPVFERFAGVELPVRVVLGRATLRVRDILKLTVGSLIELDTRPNDAVDVCVHDAVVARGEVVSIRGNYGVRVTDVISQRDRMTLQLRGRTQAHARGDRAAHQVH